MTTKYCEIVYINDWNNNIHVPQRMGTPNENQLKGSSLDNLAELAGRACYDSLGGTRSRNSKEYHEHIIEVNHGSVFEHSNISLMFHPKEEHQLLFYMSMLNRPGVWVRSQKNPVVTANLRAIREWDSFSSVESGYSKVVGDTFKNYAKQVAPLVMFDHESRDTGLAANLVSPELDEEVWVSMFINGVSRGFSHELVRHKYGTAVSQRSTRYVDESKSSYTWHPLVKEFQKDIENTLEVSLEETAMQDGEVYEAIVGILQKCLINSGVDKFTARKQARGAARGSLGNALETQMIFSANIAQWKRMILMRAHPAADAEIRVVFNEIFELLADKFPDRFIDFVTIPCPDNIGYGVIHKE